mmetsp:Transcript_9702/g.22275  ORF Transcript_9702/g.22275 Transcript_9702/m.22275 type:complete len:446 (-) Transcript_9702:8-1345(-)
MADPIVGWRRQLLMLQGLLGYVNLARPLVHAQVSLVEVLCEIVAIVDCACPAPDFDGLADHAVLGHIDIGVRGKHARIGAELVVLVQRPALHEDREAIPPGVAAVAFVDEDGVVGEEILDLHVEASAVECGVVPIALETEDLTVIQHKLDELLVGWWLAYLEFVQDLGIHGGTRRRDATLLNGLGEPVRLLPLVLNHGLIFPYVNAVLLVEPSREAVAPGDVVLPRVDCDVLPATEVVRPDEAVAIVPGRLVALQKGALWNAGVLDLWLRHPEGPVLHVVHDDDTPVPGVLVRALRDCFLVEGIKAQDLPVVLHPRRRDRGLPHVGRDDILEVRRRLRLRFRVEQAPRGHPQHLCNWANLQRNGRATMKVPAGEGVLSAEALRSHGNWHVRAYLGNAGHGAGSPQSCPHHGLLKRYGRGKVRQARGNGQGARNARPDTQMAVLMT